MKYYIPGLEKLEENESNTSGTPNTPEPKTQLNLAKEIERLLSPETLRSQAAQVTIDDYQERGWDLNTAPEDSYNFGGNHSAVFRRNFIIARSLFHTLGKQEQDELIVKLTLKFLTMDRAPSSEEQSALHYIAHGIGGVPVAMQEEVMLAADIAYAKCFESGEVNNMWLEKFISEEGFVGERTYEAAKGYILKTLTPEVFGEKGSKFERFDRRTLNTGSIGYVRGRLKKDPEVQAAVKKYLNWAAVSRYRSSYIRV